MSEPKHVLVVDDNRDLADGLSMILEAEGLAVTAAYSVEEALAEPAAAIFDAVLLDFKLPGVTGFAARRAVAERFPQALLVTMSGSSLGQLLAQVLGPRAVGVVRHPFSAATLAAALAAVEPGGVLLVGGAGEESAARLAAQLDELGESSVWVVEESALGAALGGDAALLVLDLGRPILEALDALFAPASGRRVELAGRRVLVHGRPIDPDGASSDALASRPSTGLFVKTQFSFDELVRAVRG